MVPVDQFDERTKNSSSSVLTTQRVSGAYLYSESKVGQFCTLTNSFWQSVKMRLVLLKRASTMIRSYCVFYVNFFVQEAYGFRPFTHHFSTTSLI